MDAQKASQAVFGVVLAVLLAAGAHADITTGLVGYWPLDGGAQDASGNELHGTVTNVTPVADRLGNANSAMSFTGAADSIIHVGDIPKLQLTGEMTLAAWVVLKGTNTNNSRAITKMGGTNARAWSLNIEGSSGGVRFPATFQVASSGATLVSLNDTQSLPTDEWVHMAGVYRPAEAMEVYVNGELRRANTTGIPATQHSVNSTPVMIGNLTAYKNCGWTGLIDEARIYARALSPTDIMELVTGQRGLATRPVPATDATDVPADTKLSWSPGEFAATHNIYFGTSAQDVNDASIVTPLGVLAQAGRDASTFDPGPLEFGKTYYWRIDEVNQAPDNTIYKGKVWFFTVEAYSYPVKPIKATASTAQPDMGPEKTIDGSGLTGDLHGIDQTTMWMSTGVGPNWIQYEFDRIYKLDQLLVWNSNQQVETYVGFGARGVTIATSIDGLVWTPVANVPEFSQAPGAAGYAANTTVSLGGIEAQYVKLTITTNWSGVTPPTGLAEVRFFYVPLQARLPQPPNAATGIGVDATMDWRPGREATSHTVYFGTDADAVANGAAPAMTVANHGYTPDSLELDTTYYWRVDEVGPVTHQGEVWRFSTQVYQVVDDFESYADKAQTEVYTTWVDGYDNPVKNSAIVGLPASVNGTFCDTTTVHGGRQSMPFAYDNVKAPVSEAVRTFVEPQDWTANGIKTLVLYFYGDLSNTGTELYLKINNAKVAYASAGNLARQRWNQWNVDLTGLPAATLRSVRTLTIGVSGGAGTLFFDDLRLNRQAPEITVAVDPGTVGLVGYYGMNNNVQDGSGAGNHGTIVGAPTYEAGLPAFGTALRLSGATDCVDLGKKPAFNFDGSFSLSVWANIETWTTNWGHVMVSNRGDSSVGWQLRRHNSNKICFTTRGVGQDDTASAMDAPVGEWVHIAAVYDNTARTKRIYVNGVQDALARPNAGKVAATTHNAYIGARANSGNTGPEAFFAGMLDEVRLYSRALSVGEVEFLSNPRP